MTPNELRLRNIVNIKSGESAYNYIVVAITPNSADLIIADADPFRANCITHALSDLSPVALNTVWLLKLGWNNTSRSFFPSVFAGSIISEDGGKSVRLIDSAGNFLSKSYNSVHELQNLYFALTGEELVIINE